MGKTNLTLLAIGLAASLVLSMLMQHLLRVTKDHKQTPVLREIVALYGSRMFGEPGLAVASVDGRTNALLTVRSLTGVDREKLARDVGQHLWRRIGLPQALDTVDVACVDELDASVVRFAVRRPPDIERHAASSRPSSAAESATTTSPARAPR